MKSISSNRPCTFAKSHGTKGRAALWLRWPATVLLTVATWLPLESRADDVDIYRALPASTKLLTILSLDLNANPSSTLCSNVLVDPYAANSGIPTNQQQTCSTIRSAETLGTFISTLPNSGANGIVNTASAVVGQLNVPLSNITSGATQYLTSASSTVGNFTQGQALISVAGELAKGLVGGQLGIMINHANAGTATTYQGVNYACNFSDLGNNSASLDPSNSTLRRQKTPYCSNGSFFLLGLVDLANLTNAVTKIGTSLTNTITAIQGNNPVALPTGSPVPPSIAAATTPTLPPYQGKEVYAEVVHYLQGAETYNAALGFYDFAFTQTATVNGTTNTAVVQVPLSRDTTIETTSGSTGVTSYISPLASTPSCDINLVHMQLTNSANDGDSDPNLLATYNSPDLNNDGSLAYAEVAEAASDRGFNLNSQLYKIKSTFLIQQSLSDALALNIGNNAVFPFTDTVGLLGSTRGIATLLNPINVVSATMTSLARSNQVNLYATAGTPVYTGLFQPSSSSPAWAGNLKRLELVYNSTTQQFNVLDENNVPAYDPVSGRLKAGITTGFTPISPSQAGDGGTVVPIQTPNAAPTPAGGAGARIYGVSSYTYNTSTKTTAKVTSSPGRTNATVPPDTTPHRQLYTDQSLKPLAAVPAVLGIGGTAARLGTLQLVNLDDVGASNENPSATNNSTLNLDRIADSIGATSTCLATQVVGIAAQRRQQALDAVLYARGFDIGTSTTPPACASLTQPALDHHTSATGRDWLMGAVLHSQPVAVNYGNAASPSIMVLVGSADGFLHMFDGTSGRELWAFMPESALAQQPGLRAGTSPSLPYGLDGPVSVVYTDRDPNGGPADGVISASNDYDSVVAYFGVRRTGSAYYALDITNPAAPTLLWRIGSDGLYRFLQSGTQAGTTVIKRSQSLYTSSATQTPSTQNAIANAAYASMALAFSPPSVGKVQLCSSTSTTSGSGCKLEPNPRTVLLIGGGYNGRLPNTGTNIGKDLNNSTNGTLSPDQRIGQNDSIGDAVYVVDAASGDLLWRAENGAWVASKPYVPSATPTSAGLVSGVYSHPMLNDSIVAPLNAVDNNGDGITDRTYFGDLGGRVWRMDLTNPDRSLWTLTPLASLGRQATPNSFASDRRFSTGIDYVPTRVNNIAYDALVFGSGDREDPRNLATPNFLYALFDPDTTNGRSATDTTSYAGVISTETDPRLFKQANFGPPCANAINCNLNLVTSNSDTNNGHMAGWVLGLKITGQSVISQPVTTSNTILVNSYIPAQANANDCIPSEGYSLANAYFLTTGTVDSATLLILRSGTSNTSSSSSDALLVNGFAGTSNPLDAINLLPGGRNSSVRLTNPNAGAIPFAWHERRGDEP